MRIPRRRFLRTAALAAAASAVPAPLESLLARIARGATQRAPGYGPLVRDPAGRLDLPAGFRYALFSTGVLDADLATERAYAQTLSNGDPVPPEHDGMAAFAGPNGQTVLVRNHELDPGDGPAVDPARERPYDAKGPGGTTTLWVDARRRLVKSFASLSGTLRNCAGGATPWGTWLTAEECVYLPGPVHATNHDRTPLVEQRHGYLFEVDSRATGLVAPVPLRSMGRFRHEAVAVDPATGTAYLTEDREDGLFYRWRPFAISREGRPPSRLRAGDYARGGVLEALRVKARHSLRAQNWDEVGIRVGERLAVDWVRIPEPDPDCDLEVAPDNTETDPDRRRTRTSSQSCRGQGFAMGCAQFARSEGIAHHRRSVYFCATNGGTKRLGQVFRLDLDRQELSLVVQPEDATLLDGPDNLCVAPWGDLVVCEDGGNDNHVVGLTPAGALYAIARVAHPRKRELAGATFAPDGRTLFVNVQQPGMTFAIWGPWNARRA